MKSDAYIRTSSSNLVGYNFETELIAENIRDKFNEELDLYENDKFNKWQLSSKPIKGITKCQHCKGCDGECKIAYSTRAEAYNKASSIYKKRKTTLFEYRCNYCEGWHLSKRH
ncbi:MAG: hypothetical protein HRU38_24710 [Saccharospirillaceae bacterium]|nr:hypothetical protein [Pseudomonadales bacterium]NRB81823.1 hypothetical protein [Saccharospirillaceae bacterium]